jgi:hypothetical protein
MQSGFWKPLCEQMHTASQCQHTCFLLSGGNINISQYCYHISVHKSVCHESKWQTIIAKHAMFHVMAHYKHDSLCIWRWWCSWQVKYKSLRLYSATCGMYALVRIINLLTAELLCNLRAGFFCNYFCCMWPSATIFYIYDSKNFSTTLASTAWYITC